MRILRLRLLRRVFLPFDLRGDAQTSFFHLPIMAGFSSVGPSVLGESVILFLEGSVFFRHVK